MSFSVLVEMTVVRVSPYLREDRPLLWLAEKSAAAPRVVPIAIGEFEAAAIQMPLEGEEPVRPISYDLLATMLERLGVRISRVVVERVEGSVFFARVFVVPQGTRKVGPSPGIDARPSDAVALALRTGAPIYVTRALLEEVGVETADASGDLEASLDRFHEMEPQVVRVAAAAESQPKSLPAPQPPAAPAAETPASALAQLEGQLQQAVICEEYEEAARLRDEITALRDGELDG